MIHLLGAPRWQAGTDGPLVSLSHKDAALLAKLALDGPQPRLAMTELLWPDSSGEQGYANLRSRASRLSVAADEYFIGLGDAINLSPALQIDLLRLSELETSALLAAGCLMAGVDLGDENELDRWLTKARERVAEKVASELSRRGDALEADRRLPEALDIARQLVELTPLEEAVWLRLTRLHYLRGDRAAARETYFRGAGVLRDELGIRPGAVLEELMQTVENSDRPPASQYHPLPASVLRPPRLIGRNQAWHAIWIAWQQLQPFLVVGVAGLGKSRLLEEFCRGQDGVVRETAGQGDEHVPLTALGRILVAIDRRFSPQLSAEDRQELARAHRWFGEAPSTPGHSLMLGRAIENLFASAIENGLAALVVDDLHHADLATLETLRTLAGVRALEGLRLGFATRPVADGRLPALLHEWTLDSRRLARIDLEPLSAGELGDLLSSLTLATPIDSSLADRLYRHSGGHPLFLLTTLQALLSKGYEEHAGPLPVPMSIQTLLEDRIRSLPAPAVDLVRIAAIAGQDLTAERAARLLNCSVLSLAEAWATLEAADVLRGEQFSHDLIREAALRCVPEGVSAALHRQLAAILAEDGSAAASVAWHWERGGRMSEAGRCWSRAAKAAGRSGLVQEQTGLYFQAAQCHAAAGDKEERFYALLSGLESMQMRPGGAAVLERLPEAEVLANEPEKELRWRMTRAEALLGLERAPEALVETEQAIRAAVRHAQFRADAHSLHAQALVQCLRSEDALASASTAQEAAATAADPLQELRARQALSFVNFYIGKIPQALKAQRDATALAVTLGHRFEAAAGEGHAAALLAVIGDVPAAYEQALAARARHCEVGLDRDGVVGSVNERVLGTSAAALGRFDEAIDALERAVEAAGSRAAPAALAKARLSLAVMWLTLGRMDLVRPLLEHLRDEPDPGRQVQQQLLLARAALAEGLPAERNLAAIGRAAREHPDLPLVRSIWFEWSYQGDPQAAVDRLRIVRADCERLGLHGTARSLQWRELERSAELRGASATRTALACARNLEPHVENGLSAKCHPPEVWLTLSRTYARAGDRDGEARCLTLARKWLRAAGARLSAVQRKAFFESNPLHARIMNGAPGPTDQ